MYAPRPIEEQQPLRHVRVLVAGAGGAGMWSTLALRCAGAEVVVIDDDRIEEKNFVRLPLPARRELVGRHKVEALRESFGIKGIVGRYPNDVPSDIGKLDYVVDCTDQPRTEHFAAAQELGAFYARAGYDAREPRRRQMVTVIVGVPVFGNPEPGYTASVWVAAPAVLAGVLVEALRFHERTGEPVVLSGTVEYILAVLEGQRRAL